MTYSERALQQTTQSGRKRSVSVASSARQQDRSASRPFAVFDIDGTLIRWQLYHAVVDKLAKKGLLGTSAQRTLQDARMVWKRREHSEAFRAYELELITVYEEALPSLSAEDFDTCVDEVAEEYKTQVYTYTRDLATKLKKHGYVLIAISGSHQELVEHIAKQYGFDIWVGTQYHRDNGRFTGEKVIGSHDKKTTLERVVKEHNLSLANSYAVGDSQSDAVMLELVDNPIAFNPDQALLKIAQTNGWPIVIERKNVVYKLEGRDGSYVLAQTG